MSSSEFLKNENQNNKKEWKALWIDIDGTLLDFDACAKDCMKKCYKDWNLDWEEFHAQTFTQVNTRLWKDIEDGKLDLEGLRQIRWNRIFEKIGIENVDGPAFEDRFREYLNESHEPIKEALEALVVLSRHYPLFVVTNGPGAQQRNRLKKAGMLEMFEEVFNSEELEAQKPDQAFFEKAWNMTRDRLPNVEKEDVLVIGDSIPADIEGAETFGIPALWFTTDSNKRNSHPERQCATSWREALAIVHPGLEAELDEEVSKTHQLN